MKRMGTWVSTLNRRQVKALLKDIFLSHPEIVGRVLRKKRRLLGIS